MKVYIGLGGIGISALKKYSESISGTGDARFYYLDCDESINELYDDVYVFSGVTTSALRCTGKNAIKYELYSGKLNSYFSGITEADDIELIFVTSSFGGFGSGVVIPLAEYLEAIVWNKLKSCHVVAFNEAVFANGGFSKQILQVFESNTTEFVRDCLAFDQNVETIMEIGKSRFNPGITMYLINTKDCEFDNCSTYIGYSAEKLETLDCKADYKISLTGEAKRPVFISYNKNDRGTAELIVRKLEESGIKPWIDFKEIGGGSYPKYIMQGIRDARVFIVLISKDSIRSQHVKNEIDRAFCRLNDGLVIIPFILDDAEMDDECKYYLCRQQKISGKQPPLDMRVDELISKVREILG